LVDKPQFDASPFEICWQGNRIAHVAGQAVQHDGIHAVDATKVDCLAQLLHGRPIECRPGEAFIVQPVPDPREVVLSRAPDVLLTG
jgi:hypothetical protein